MKKGLRNDRGSVTVFVLASCLFFLVSVIGVQEYTKNKQMAVEDDYRQIKQNYEKDIGNQRLIYDNLKEIEISGNIAVKFKKQEDYLIPTDSNTCVITQQFTIVNESNKKIESISYGWSNNENTQPENWENVSVQMLSRIVKKTNAVEGDYYFWVKIIDEKNQEVTNNVKITVLKEEITIAKSATNLIIKYPTNISLFNKKVGQGESYEEAKANLENNENSSIDILSKNIYIETTDSHGNKISKNIISDPIFESTEYGKEVNYGVEYEDSLNEGAKWEIFYANKNNVYIITRGTVGSQSLNSNIANYSGTGDFLDSEKLTNYPSIMDGWLYKTFNNGEIIQENENHNMQATQYLLDSINVWNGTYMNTYGKWAIGGPTLELLLASYNATNKQNMLEIQGVTNLGYPQTISSGLIKPSAWNHNQNYWLACPSSEGNPNDLRVVREGNEWIGTSAYHNSNGIRPIVCLKSNVIFTWNEESQCYDLSL